MSPLWIAITIGLVLLAFGVAAWFYTRKPGPGLNDRYTAEPLIVREQVAMLEYLVKAFPGQVVVPNVPLRNMLSVRRAAHRQRAEERLNDQKVDFVVCGEDGRPLFAFDLEQYHLSDVKTKAHQAKIKNRLLKTAGVRLVYVKASINRMPSPDEFREQLNLAALPRPALNRRATDREPESALQQLESQFAESELSHSPSTFRESEVMDVSGLAELDEMLGRPGSRRVRDSGPDSLQSGQSGFDGGTSDVRGR
jgi:hypothetical protein